MTTTISVAGLFLALFLLVYLAFKGHSVIIIAPIVAMVAVIFLPALTPISWQIIRKFI